MPMTTGFTRKQARFLDLFEGNASAAARAAGYRNKNAAWKLMRRPMIRQAAQKKLRLATTALIRSSATKLANKISYSAVRF